MSLKNKDVTEPNLLDVRNLSMGFRDEDNFRMVVDNVSFSVKQGKTLAIVGESGSGKSVTCLSILQLHAKGRVRFYNGKFSFSPDLFKDKNEVVDLLPDSPELIGLRGKSVSMIFQEPMTALNPVLTNGRQVEEMIRKHLKLSKREARKRCLELFSEVLLPNPEVVFKKYPHELSGGQRQRVMIAMAISCDPKILIADEPTTALDVTVQKSILALLKSLQKKHGMAMIFITHDLGVVQDIADDVLVMQKGNVVEYGTVNAVMNAPSHAYTQGLLACRPHAGVKVDRLPTVDEFISGQRLSIQPANQVTPGDPGVDLLTVETLRKVYFSGGGLFGEKQSFKALEGVSFSIKRGETLGLVGESGCGKTTLSRIVTGLIAPTSGNVLFNGLDIHNRSASQMRAIRKQIQIIFQDPYSSLNPRIRIGDAISEPMKTLGLNGDFSTRKRATIKLLDRVGLTERSFDKYPHEFSGGQRQRIVIARALAVQPSFIVCDESVSALDVSVQAQVLNLLNELKRDLGLTYLFISHDLAVVYQMSDRIMVMKSGCIEEIDKAERVFYHPKSEYTKQLLQAIPGSNSSV